MKTKRWIASASLRVKSVVRTYLTYNVDCSPEVWDKFHVEIEKIYSHDRYVVAIKVDRRIRHVPREYSKVI